MAFKLVIKLIKDEPDRTWSLKELHDFYLTKGGADTHRSRFLSKIMDGMKSDIYVFKSLGLSPLIIHRNRASSLFNLVKIQDEEDNTEHTDVKRVAKRIQEEMKEMPRDKSQYTPVTPENLRNSCGETLKMLLSEISPNFNDSLQEAMIGSIVQNVTANVFTPFQISLGLLLHEKKYITELSKYSICCSYDETKRFKQSAAVHKKFKGTVLDSKDGLIQYVTDNFDAQICSQNGIKQTHGLASIVTQPMSEEAPGSINIPRVAKTKLTDLQIDETNKKTFVGVRNPEISKVFVSSGVLPLKVLSKMVCSLECSKVTNFKFIKDSLTKNDVPDYNGYCTAEARIDGKPLLPQTKILYQPYIDEPPTDPSTILTAMEDAEQITQAAGQKYTIFTADQQLYAIVLNIISCNPERWKFFIPRLGGMHWLMSFIGACGSLMKGSGLHQYLSSAFAGVNKMLVGKKFPMNMRALRLAAIEILRDHVDLENITGYDDLISALDSLSEKSILAEHWIENLIKPVLLMMMFVKAEREADFALHLFCCKMMMPYFFAAKHVNYARYGICYINTMEKLPSEVLTQFMKGEHVMRHQKGIWNAIWSDMMIETSYMKIGKGPVGVIGFTTSSTTMSVWAKSMHAQTTYLSELYACRGG